MNTSDATVSPPETTATGDPPSSEAPGGTSPDGSEAKTYTEAQVKKIIEAVQAQAAPAAVQPTAFDYGEKSPDDYLTIRDAQKLVQENVYARYDAGFKTLYNQNLARMEKDSRRENPDLWKKFGDEMRTELEQRKGWKILDDSDFEGAANVVKGRHGDWFARNAHDRQMSSMPMSGSERATPSGPSPVSDGSPFAELPDWYKDMMRRANMTEDQLKIMCSNTGVSPKQFIESVARGEIVTDSIPDNLVFRSK